MLGIYGQLYLINTESIGGGCDDIEIDDIVKVVRFPGWQNTNQGRNDVEKAIKSIFIKKRMFENQLFEKAYSYVEQYY